MVRGVDGSSLLAKADFTMPVYDPNSNDAMFATICQRLDDMSASQTRIESALVLRMDKTEERVKALEQEKWFQRGIAAAVAATASAAWRFISSGPKS